MKPNEMYDKLNEYVIGQDRAKKILSVAIYNHMKRINHVQTDVEIEKSNVLLIGPTGSGKTYIVQSIAKILDVPLHIADSSVLTQSGYTGDDISVILRGLVMNAGGDILKAQKGIIYIDEIDKLAVKGETGSSTQDPSRGAVQEGLLKILEGTISEVPLSGQRKNPNGESFKIDTTNILFIIGGAFVGLEKSISQNKSSSKMGFGEEIIKTNEESIDLSKVLTPQDLIRFGMLPEFMGRIPITAVLKELDADDILKILTEPKNSIIKQYVRLFEIDGVELTFTEDALKSIVELTMEHGLGARGLRRTIENVMVDIMFEVPKKLGMDLQEVIINMDTIVNGTGAEYVYLLQKDNEVIEEVAG